MADPKLDDEGNPIPPDPTPTPEERKYALRELVRAKFQEARDDELMESYARRPDNNPAVQKRVDDWRERKGAAATRTGEGLRRAGPRGSRPGAAQSAGGR